MKKRSKAGTLLKMLGLVKPLTGFMCLAVLTGTLAFLAVQFIPILGGFAVLHGRPVYVLHAVVGYLFTVEVNIHVLRRIAVVAEERTAD